MNLVLINVSKYVSHYTVIWYAYDLFIMRYTYLNRKKKSWYLRFNLEQCIRKFIKEICNITRYFKKKNPKNCFIQRLYTNIRKNIDSRQVSFEPKLEQARHRRQFRIFQKILLFNLVF